MNPAADTTTLGLIMPPFYVDPVWDWDAAGRPKRNGSSQATRRREIRRRSNLPKAVQRRLGFKCK